jgi:hypothetical protein
MLSLSLIFKQNGDRYYGRLQFRFASALRRIEGRPARCCGSMSVRQRPIWQAPKLAKAMDLTGPGVRKQIATMIEEEVLREISGKERYQVYCCQRYLDILNEGTEPLKRAA